MRVRSKVLVSLGIAALALGSVAGGALAHGGHGKHMGKNLKVDVSGEVTVAADGLSVTVDPDGAVGPLAPWTCMTRPGKTIKPAAAGAIGRLRCVDNGSGALVVKKLKVRGDNSGNSGKGKDSMDHGGGVKTGRVEIEAKGLVQGDIVQNADGTQSITVLPGATTAAPTSTLPAVTCTIVPGKTRILGTPIAGDVVKIKCKSRDGMLVAKKIKERNLLKAGKVQVEVKGTVDAIGADSITVAGIPCATTDAQEALFAGAGIVQGAFVEMKCTGTPFALFRIHLED